MKHRKWTIFFSKNIILILFVTNIILGQKNETKTDLINGVESVNALPPGVLINGQNKTVLTVGAPIDNNNEEFGTIDLTAATDNPADEGDLKFKLWKNQNEELVYFGNFLTLGSIEANDNIIANKKITTDNFRMVTGAGVGKYLQSDASGNASWVTLSGGSGSIDGLSDGKSSPVNSNVYLGQYAGDSDNSTSFRGNTALGYSSMDALLSNTNGGENTAVGYGSMGEFTGGRANTAVGFEALHGFNGPATGTENTAIGTGALYKNTTGTGNVAIGFEAGYDETGSDKLYIHNARTSSPLIWGDFQFADVVINGSLEVTGGITGTISPSDSRYKKNVKTLYGSLNKILNIRGVSYNWKKEEFPNERFNNEQQIGLIAQEVEQYFPELVKTFDDGFKGVDYTKFSAVLVEAVKEQNLEFRNENAELKMRIEKLENQKLQVLNKNTELENRLSKIESLLDGKRFTQTSN